MPVPEQVRKQTEAISKFYTNNGKSDETISDEAIVDSVNDETSEQTNNAPVGNPSEPRKPAENNETAEQRYRTLQGMYNADIGRLRTENQGLSARVAQLESLLSSLQTSAPAEQPQHKTFVTQADIDEYGDSIDLMRRVSREQADAMASEIESLKNTIRQMQTTVVPRMEQVATAQAQTAEQSFWSTLNVLVPDWQAINNDTGFHAWLLEPDPLSGSTRQHYLEAAHKALDVNRVARFFTTWKGNSGQSSAQPANRVVQDELSKQVSPGRGRAAPTPQSEEKKTYTPEFITNFYNDVRKGAYKGREEERNRIERNIFAATSENRIT